MNALEKYVEIDHEIKRLEAKKDELRASIGELEEGGANVVNDNYRMAVSANRRFDPALAKKLLSEEDFKKILKISPDVKLAQKHIAPSKLDEMYTTSGQKWVIKERDDK